MTDIIILIACTLCGYACGKYLERRVKNKGVFLADLNRYVSLLKVNIEGRQLELSKFNSEFCRNCSQVFQEYLASSKIKCSLPTAQKESVASFFSNLSCSSSQALTRHLEYYSTVFADMEKQFNDKEMPTLSMYVKLGILLGVMLGIVLM